MIKLNDYKLFFDLPVGMGVFKVVFNRIGFSLKKVEKVQQKGGVEYLCKSVKDEIYLTDDDVICVVWAMNKEEAKKTAEIYIDLYWLRKKHYNHYYNKKMKRRKS